MRAERAWPRLAGSALALSAAVLVPVAGAVVRADSGTPGSVDYPFAYGADAEVSAAEVMFSYAGFGQILDAQYPHVHCDLGSPSESRCHASPLDLGQLVATVPSQVRGYGMPFPDYPLGADADYPQTPAMSGGPANLPASILSIGGGTWQGGATQHSGSGTATGASLAFNPTLPVFSADAGQAQGQTEVTAGGRINASVAADLTNVLLFGVLSIQHLSVHSAAAAASDGAGTSSGDMTLTGVSAQGEALTIDARGIHALGQSQTVPLQSVNQGLAALSSAGVTAAIVPAHQSAVLGRAHYDGEVLQVSETLPDGVVATVDLGSSVIDLFTQPYALAPVPTFQGEAGGVTAAWIPGSPGVPAGHPQPGAPATASTIPGTAQATGLPRLARTAALARVPPALLLGLLSLFEAAMLALVVALLWPAGSTGGGETLSVL